MFQKIDAGHRGRFTGRGLGAGGQEPDGLPAARRRTTKSARHGERGPQGLGRRVQRYQRPRGADPGQRTCAELAVEVAAAAVDSRSHQDGR